MMYHCHMDLDTLLKLTLRGEKVLVHEDGTYLNEREIYQLVKNAKEQGYKNFTGGCDNVTPDGCCGGHIELS